MLQNVQLRKLLYLLLLLGASLIVMQYIPGELVLTITLIIFIFLSNYFNKPANTGAQEIGCDELSRDRLVSRDPIVVSTKILAQQCVDSIQNNRDDLSHLIAIQEDAISTLSDAFMAIQSLLAQQQSDINHLLSIKLDTHSGAVEVFEVTERVSSQHLSEPIADDLERIASELTDALHSAMRALQFGDISVQSLQFTVDDLTLLSDALQQLGRIDSAEIADDIKHVAQKYQQATEGRAHNPVSSSSMDSGEVELF